MWSYEPPLDVVVGQLKFGRLAYLARHLGEALAQRGRGDLAGVHRIVPVPLHWRRHLSRGYNQSAEIARALGRQLGLPVTRALRRRRITRAQTSLPRSQRQLNVREAFRVRRASDLKGQTVALVDDVMTTGATLESCSRSLKEAGATTVVALVAARTPPRTGRDLEGPPENWLHRGSNRPPSGIELAMARD